MLFCISFFLAQCLMSESTNKKKTLLQKLIKPSNKILNFSKNNSERYSLLNNNSKTESSNLYSYKSITGNKKEVKVDKAYNASKSKINLFNRNNKYAKLKVENDEVDVSHIENEFDLVFEPRPSIYLHE